jgi:hypothetical protein
MAPASQCKLLKGGQMRIQETDRILKESRHARHSAQQHQHDDEGVMQRAMRMISSLPMKFTGLFRKH